MDWGLPLAVQLLGWLGPRMGKVADRLVARYWTATEAYEVEDYRVTLDLLDRKGSKARYQVDERIRFLRDGVASFHIYGWGTGQTFAAHRVHPGRVVERRKLGSRYRSLIALPRAYHRGEKLTLRVRRHIRGGFTGRPNWLEVEARPRMRRIRLAVALPNGARFKTCELLGREGLVTTKPAITVSPAGRYQARAMVNRPAVGDLYVLRWDW